MPTTEIPSGGMGNNEVTTLLNPRNALPYSLGLIASYVTKADHSREPSPGVMILKLLLVHGRHRTSGQGFNFPSRSQQDGQSDGNC